MPLEIVAFDKKKKRRCFVGNNLLEN